MGGSGGGGRGSTNDGSSSQAAGTANTGGGGGGGGLQHTGNTGSAGGSGIVVIRIGDQSVISGGGGVFQLGKDSLKMSITDNKLIVQNNATALITGTTNIVDTVWNHIAVSRKEGDVKAFLNGVQEGSTVVSSTHDFNSNNLLNIGKVTNAAADGSGGYTYTEDYYNGYMDEFRITRGTGRYSDTFSVPVQEFGNQKPLVVGDQSYNSVSLSTHMNGTEGGQVFTDTGPNSQTITAVGDVQTKQYVAPVAATAATYGPDPNADPLWDKVEVLLQGGATDVSKNAYPIYPFRRILKN